MTDSSKRVAVGGDKLDRLTGLPTNVIHQIQACMSVEDATRMSVLSSTWRYVCSSNPKLIFDTEFCTKRTPAETIDIISTILLQHHGAIKEFLVDISRIHSSQHSVVDKWMLFLSRNGLVDLTLQNLKNVDPPYKMPSYVFRMGLERLALSNCIFGPPYSFRGFDKLRRLSLNRVAFELKVVTSPLWMPNLVSLHVVECSGLRFLNMYAPELLQLYFYACGIDTPNLSPYKDCRKLKVVGIAPQKEVSLNSQDKAMILTILLSSWPNLVCLILDRYLLKVFASGTKAERLPTSFNRLGVLYLLNYDFDREDQLFPLLCILRSCPNLLELQFLRKKSDMEVDVNLLEGPNCRTQALNNLQKLLIKKFHGSRTELHFVRFILASAPFLRKAILLVDTSVHEAQSLKISRELMRFPRASPKAEIIYDPWSDKHARLSVLNF